MRIFIFHQLLKLSILATDKRYIFVAYCVLQETLKQGIEVEVLYKIFLFINIIL